MCWERDQRSPIVSAYPDIIQFLGFEPWRKPATLAEALLAERRRRGLNIAAVAELISVDERNLAPMGTRRMEADPSDGARHRWTARIVGGGYVPRSRPLTSV